MKNYALIAAFLLVICPAAFADDLPSAKDPATKSDSPSEAKVSENNHTDMKSEKMEEKFDVARSMNACLTDHNNDKTFCSKSAMAECMKSMSKADCRKAVKSAKK